MFLNDTEQTGDDLTCLPVVFYKYQALPMSSLSCMLELISHLMEEI